MADAAISLQCLAGHDLEDPASANSDVPDYQAALTGNIRGLRIGVIRHFFEEDAPVSSEVHAAMETAIGVFAGLGAQLSDVRLRPLEVYQDIKVTQAEPEVFSIHQHDLRQRLGDYGEEFRGRGLPACLITAGDYLAASRSRAAMVAEMGAMYRNFDAFLTVGPGPASVFGQWRVIEFWRGGSITAPFNVTGAPALVQCMGFTESGLPMSLQISGRPFEDSTVLRIADAYERETHWLTRRPDLELPTCASLPEVPEPAASTLTERERDRITLIAERAGLQLGERDLEQLCASAPYVAERTARAREPRGIYEPPSNIYRRY